MRTPRYTDNRYPHGYRRAANTDIAATFRRVRAQQKAQAEQAERDQAERAEKLRPMRRSAK